MQYHNDIIFRKKMKKKAKLYHKEYYKRKKNEDPEWNKRRQREFRQKHPEAFNYLMCRYYFKRLNEDQKINLLTELENEGIL